MSLDVVYQASMGQQDREHLPATQTAPEPSEALSCRDRLRLRGMSVCVPSRRILTRGLGRVGSVADP
jgi:hypothetical protein